MRMNTFRKQSGFTLVELLLVLVLIGILATLAIPRYMTYRDRGCIAAATCDLDLIRRVLSYYTADWDTYPPSAASYQDLQDQLVDVNGDPLGTLPAPHTFEFLTYTVDANANYVVRVRALDNGKTILIATPDAIERE